MIDYESKSHLSGTHIQLFSKTTGIASNGDSNENEEDVSVELVIQNLKKNINTSKKMIYKISTSVNLDYDCECSNALKNAIITNIDSIPKEIDDKLSLFTKKYL